MVAKTSSSNFQLVTHQPVRVVYLAFAVATLGLFWTFPAMGQEKEEVWEYSPYRVKVWVALELTPELGPGTLARINKEIVWLSEQVDLSGWRVTPEAVPVAWQSRILQDLDALTLPEKAEDRLKELGDADKLIFVGVKKDGQGYRVTSREYDGTTEILGPVFS
ncbi:MAG: hypothetical protein VXY82_06895, partial [Planctomycetota bacterium]|nr:hypothetical protein [Planctomycetota bacterium]